MLKFASLSSLADSLKLVIRIRACIVAGPVTVHDWRPSLARPAKTTTQVVPASRESSILTFPVSPVELHLMSRLTPVGQSCPPFGDSTEMEAVGGAESSSVIVPCPTPPASVACVGLLRLTKNVSL